MTLFSKIKSYLEVKPPIGSLNLEQSFEYMEKIDKKLTKYSHGEKSQLWYSLLTEETLQSLNSEYSTVKLDASQYPNSDMQMIDCDAIDPNQYPEINNKNVFSLRYTTESGKQSYVTAYALPTKRNAQGNFDSNFDIIVVSPSGEIELYPQVSISEKSSPAGIKQKYMCFNGYYTDIASPSGMYDDEYAGEVYGGYDLASDTSTLEYGFNQDRPMLLSQLVDRGRETQIINMFHNESRLFAKTENSNESM